ncbi:hypothetical protein [Paenibacillus bouchesdurhonensis]|uniref:hypothetical protein n=1 Tax=Paenibacillus bouchesdurhonensis TaxID=1870990 RepID=UPI000DA612CF|nr:hypothetical protein [Paenibacillus bouchesdurhonensis]
MNFNFIEPPPTMNIYSQKGDRVRFLNKNGHDWEPERAREIGLVEGEIYTVERTDVGGWHTDVYLQEIPGYHFNSVMFENHKETVPETEELHIPCSICAMTQVVTVRRSDLQQYNEGAHAQHAFPYLSADERELIISGVCGKCFDELFEDDGDEG